MVESKVIIDRKDYISICEKLELIKEDIVFYRKSEDERILKVMEKKISAIQNILSEAQSVDKFVSEQKYKRVLVHPRLFFCPFHISFLPIILLIE